MITVYQINSLLRNQKSDSMLSFKVCVFIKYPLYSYFYCIWFCNLKWWPRISIRFNTKKMKSKFINFIIVIFCSWTLAVQADSDEALQECANLHHIEIHNIPNARANFENSKCQLHCFVGQKNLSIDSINEGFSCPLDSNGVSWFGIL